VTEVAKYPDIFSTKQKRHITEWCECDFSFIEKHNNSKKLDPVKVKGDTDNPRRLRIAETVLKFRSDRILIVLEKCYNSFNQNAVMRSAECLGILNVYVVVPVEQKHQQFSKRITRGNEIFLNIRLFHTTSECLQALREEGREIWATDLSPSAVSIADNSLVIPPKVAVIFGSEADGCSKEVLDAADKRIYYPLSGFTESLNLSVAAALIMYRLIHICPEARGDLTEEKKRELRKDWYTKLASSEARKQEYLDKYLDNPPPPMEDLRKDDEERSGSFVPKNIKDRIKNKEQNKEEDLILEDIDKNST